RTNGAAASTVAPGSRSARSRSTCRSGTQPWSGRQWVAGSLTPPPGPTPRARGRSSRDDLPREHHVVVLVREVVAVRDVGPAERADPARDHALLAGFGGNPALLARVVRVAAVRRGLPVARAHAVLLLGGVQGVAPAAAAVADPPRRPRAVLDGDERPGRV